MYQALYRKYRPKTFDEVVGQNSITQTLKAQLSSGRLSHAYLFTGTRGTGKTSCAKILAKAVNCEHPVDGNPCNCCPACKSIESGACMDVLEIDAASNNGVDNVRSLRDDAIYTPSEVKKRVYIIDEVHMLSLSAFNALLKIIEEPPEHLLFILATTELNKVPATILSRCQRFSFRRLTPEDIASRINYAAYQEGIDITPDAMKLLARLADGAMRDGMSLLDQCASAADGTLTVEEIYRCLGLAGNRNITSLFDAISRHDTAQALSVFSKMYSEGKDLAAFLNEMCDLARDLLLMKTAPSAADNMLCGLCTESELNELLPKFSGGELLRMVEIIQSTSAGFTRSASRRVDVELCLLQLCEPSLSLDAESINARLSRLEDKISSGSFTAASPAPKAEPLEVKAEEEEEEERPPLPDDNDDPFAAPARSVQRKSDFWPELVEKLQRELRPPVSGFFLAGAQSPVKGVLKGSVLYLECAPGPFKPNIEKPDVLAIVQEKAQSILGQDIRVRVIAQGGRTEDENDGINSLLSFGSQHSDIFEIK
ncbi:MAG: DNA polymerase III subunit gamma/tau [Clostridia bacterium]|nr:DNA polymerase III subunit gamma/tau [Clostridia bacterium]